MSRQLPDQISTPTKDPSTPTVEILLNLKTEMVVILKQLKIVYKLVADEIA
jgi:hypothetical protein